MFLAFMQLVVTLTLNGPVWFVQLVHYPLLKYIDRIDLYEREHFWRTNWLAFPLMSLEAFFALALLVVKPAPLSYFQVISGFVLVVLLWIMTLKVQMPLHRKLSKGFNQQAYRQLVITNWIRTAGWSLRSALCVWMLVRMIRYS